MTNGQKLSDIIYTSLVGKKLSTSEQIVLRSHKGGSYEPTDAEFASLVADVKRLARKREYTELLRIYKQLPTPQGDSQSPFYIDNKKVSSTEWFASTEDKHIEIVGTVVLESLPDKNNDDNTMAKMPPKERLLELYAGLGFDTQIELLFSEPTDDKDLVENYLTSKLWRLNNLYQIVDKFGVARTFTMNDNQHQVYVALLRHPRVILLKSRQIGGSTLASLANLDDALFLANLNIGLMAQGKDEAATLLSRIKMAWDEFPEPLKDLMEIDNTSDNKTEFEFSNRSTIFIRTSFRSATLQRLWISEFAKISVKYPEKAKEVVTGTLPAVAAGNPVLIESTAERGGRFQQMWDESYRFSGERAKLDFFPLFIGWTQDSSCVLDTEQYITQAQNDYFTSIEAQLSATLTDEQKWFYVAKQRELGDEVTQEYPSTPTEAFMGSKDGSYYGKALRASNFVESRFVSNLYDSGLDVFVSVDLGINDEFVMVFFQVHQGESKPQYRIIHIYGNSGEGIEHYVEYAFKMPYKISQVFLPHDAKVRDLSTGKTRVQRFKELGMRRVKTLQRADVATGIEQVRKMIPSLWIDKEAVYALNALQNYTKEWDDKHGTWKDKPLHDKWSNPADAIRYMAMAIRTTTESKDVRSTNRGYGFVKQYNRGFAV